MKAIRQFSLLHRMELFYFLEFFLRYFCCLFNICLIGFLYAAVTALNSRLALGFTFWNLVLDLIRRKMREILLQKSHKLIVFLNVFSWFFSYALLLRKISNNTISTGLNDLLLLLLLNSISCHTAIVCEIFLLFFLLLKISLSSLAAALSANLSNNSRS